eukprot:TRINITY_DN3865_c0_g2_i2.p1 TRINITY_DN3865_c0_g2~~TRINITY_DN3865_c0_g2_i2.p1  ORF type:complete len:238 (+),score=21.76 TRINITY_DN3865_c0_g2_i2:27-740(+)
MDTSQKFKLFKGSKAKQIVKSNKTSNVPNNLASSKASKKKKNTDLVESEENRENVWSLNRVKFQSSCEEIYSTPFKELPVHTDLHRFMKGCVIYDHLNSEKLFEYLPEERNMSPFQASKLFLKTLSEKIDSCHAQTEFIEQNLLNLNSPTNPGGGGGGEFSKDMDRFFTSILARTELPNKMFTIVKCVNQVMISPAVTELKELICKYPFKDRKAGSIKQRCLPTYLKFENRLRLFQP